MGFNEQEFMQKKTTPIEIDIGLPEIGNEISEGTSSGGGGGGNYRGGSTTSSGVNPMFTGTNSTTSAPLFPEVPSNAPTSQDIASNFIMPTGNDGETGSETNLFPDYTNNVSNQAPVTTTVPVTGTTPVTAGTTTTTTTTVPVTETTTITAGTSEPTTTTTTTTTTVPQNGSHGGGGHIRETASSVPSSITYSLGGGIGTLPPIGFSSGLSPNSTLATIPLSNPVTDIVATTHYDYEGDINIISGIDNISTMDLTKFNILQESDIEPLLACLDEYIREYDNIKKHVENIDYQNALIIESSDLIQIEMNLLLSRIDTMRTHFEILKSQIKGKTKRQQTVEINRVIGYLTEDKKKLAYEKGTTKIMYDSIIPTEGSNAKNQLWEKYVYLDSLITRIDNTITALQGLLNS